VQARHGVNLRCDEKRVKKKTVKKRQRRQHAEIGSVQRDFHREVEEQPASKQCAVKHQQQSKQTKDRK
jgi:hypothetical protein